MEEDSLAEAIGKKQGTVNLSVIERIPSISVVEGDNGGNIICLSYPYRGNKYSKEYNDEWEFVRLLKSIKRKYDSYSGIIQREINRIECREKLDE